MSINCAIKLNHSKDVVAVSGVVEVNLLEECIVKALNVRLLGYVTGALCMSAEGGKEYFVVLKIGIYDTPTILPSGLHSYKFKFNLLDDLPPTIISETFEVRYKIRATLEQPWDQDKIYQTCFNLSSTFKANLVSSIYHQPFVMSKFFKYFSLINLNSRVGIKFFIPRTFYTIDDVIPVSFEVNNMSTTNVHFKLTLKQNITYWGTILKRHNVPKTVTVNCMRVKRTDELVVRSTHENFVYKMRVPHVPATKESSMISVGYKLVVTVRGQGLHVDRFFSTPIVIVNKA